MVPPASDSGTCRVAPASETSSAWLPSAQLETERRLAALASRRSRRAHRPGWTRPTASRASAPPPRCCASTAPDRRRARAAARRRARRPSTAAWCASRSASAATGIGTSRAAGTGNGTEPTRAGVMDPDAGHARAEGEGGGARDSGAGSDPASVTAGCGPRDGTRENGAGGPAGPAAARRATGTGWVSPWVLERTTVSSDSSAASSAASISRVTPAGRVSSIGWRGPNAGCGRGARCSAETGTVGACATVAANAGATRIRVPTPGFVSSCDGIAGDEPAPGTAGAGGSGFGARPAGAG